MYLQMRLCDRFDIYIRTTLIHIYLCNLNPLRSKYEIFNRYSGPTIAIIYGPMHFSFLKRITSIDIYLCNLNSLQSKHEIINLHSIPSMTTIHMTYALFLTEAYLHTPCRRSMKNAGKFRQ